MPNEYVFGTLLGNAARGRSYEYLTVLLKKMVHHEVAPNDTILKILDSAAAHKTNVSCTLNPLLCILYHCLCGVYMQGMRQARRQSGFKGYYNIWRKLMTPND